MTENTTASGAADRVTELLPELLKLVQAQRAYIHAMPAVTADAFHAMPGFDGDWAAEIEARAVEALAASAPVAPAPQPVPDGFVLVPVEPTPEMVRAAYSGPMQGGLLAAVPKAALVHTRNSGDVEQHAALQQGEYLPLQGLAAYLHAESVGVCTCTPHETLRKWAIEVDRVSRGAAQAAPADQRNTKTHDLLSTMIGLFMGQRHKIGYKDNSVIAKVVAEAVEHLKDWPYPEAQPAPVAEDAEIRKALHDAATSLETISRIAGKDQYMLEMVDVRIYAAARAKVARDAQAAQQPEGGA